MAATAVPKTPKSAMTKAPPAHPTYLQMVTEAVSSLKERTGSSSVAIAKHIESKHKNELPGNFKKILSTQLKNMAKQGKLVKVKNSFKLSEVVAKVVKVKPVAPGKPKSVKVKSAKAKVVAKSPKKVKPAAKEGSAAKELKKAVASVPKKKGASSVPKKAAALKKLTTPKKAGRPKKAGTPKKTVAPKPVKEKKAASAKKAPAAKKAKK